MPVFAIAFAGYAAAQTAAFDIAREESTRHAACLARIESEPHEAYEDGLAWLAAGARPLARHCTAMALMALGKTEEAAARLEALAAAPDAGSIETRIVYLGQAGNAWLAAGLPDAAIVTLTNAIKLAPRDPDLRIDRAAAHLLKEQWSLAIADLDLALNVRPSDAEALRLRAEAKLLAEKPGDALEDIRSAMAADPANIDTLVLRGRIREAIRLASD